MSILSTRVSATDDSGTMQDLLSDAYELLVILRSTGNDVSSINIDLKSGEVGFVLSSASLAQAKDPTYAAVAAA